MYTSHETPLQHAGCTGVCDDNKRTIGGAEAMLIVPSDSPIPGRPPAMSLFEWLTESKTFVPHGHCYLWQPSVLWLNVISDALIAGAYFVIPLIIWRYLSARRGEVQTVWVPALFAAFIFLCGITHAMEIYTVWTPTYRVAGLLKGLTAIASVLTAISLIFVMPKALQLQTPLQLQREVALRTGALEEANSALHLEVAARRSSENALRESEAALRSASERLNRFLATLSHELRNPLAPIVNFVALMEQEALTPLAAHARDVIGRQARHMGRMLDDLLDVSRVLNDRIRLQYQSITAAELIGRSVEAAAPVIEAKQHRLTVSDGAAHVLYVDADRITQVLTNLLINASRYQHAAGEIDVSVTADGAWMQFDIRDGGYGIEAQHLDTIFEPFSQFGDHRETGRGLGIGLAFSRHLVTLHGGSISAASDGPGKGSCFSVRLPIRRAP